MKKLGILLLGILVVACAYSPQQIQIRPDIGVDGERYGAGRSIAVTASDQRAQMIIGTRGGVYADSSTISVANSLTDAIVQAATAKLAAQGFSVNGAQADAQMNIIIDKISYDLADNGVLKKVVLDAEFRVVLEQDNKTFTSRYQTNKEYEVIKSPSPDKNEKMINELISNTLQRIFVDPKVQAFLTF